MTIVNSPIVGRVARETSARAVAPSVAEQIRELARAHGVMFERTALDDYADTVSRLSDAEVTHDETENLLLALYRAGVIDAEQNATLHHAYIVERQG